MNVPSPTVIGNVIRKGNFILYVISGAFIVFTLLVTFSDVVGRYFRKPVPGAYELSELALASMVFLALAHTQARRGHVFLDLLILHLPRLAQNVLAVITSFLGLCLAGLIAWCVIPWASYFAAAGEITDLLDIPIYPFKFLLFVGAAALSCQFILDLVDSFRQFGRYSGGNST